MHKYVGFIVNWFFYCLLLFSAIKIFYSTTVTLADTFSLKLISNSYSFLTFLNLVFCTALSLEELISKCKLVVYEKKKTVWQFNNFKFFFLFFYRVVNYKQNTLQKALTLIMLKVRIFVLKSIWKSISNFFFVLFYRTKINISVIYKRRLLLLYLL